MGSSHLQRSLALVFLNRLAEHRPLFLPDALVLGPLTFGRVVLAGTSQRDDAQVFREQTSEAGDVILSSS